MGSQTNKLCRLSGFSVLATLALLAWTSTAQAYYCGQYPGAIEKLVCAQPDLMALDDEMKATYRATLDARTTDDKPRLEAEQNRWLWERWKACGKAGPSPAEPQAAQQCLRTDYLKRIAALRNWHPAPWAHDKSITLPVLPDPIDPESILTAMFGPKAAEDDDRHPWIVYGPGANNLAGDDSVVSTAFTHRFVKDGTEYFLLVSQAHIEGGGHHTPGLIGGAIYHRVNSEWQPVTATRIITAAGLYGTAPAMKLEPFGQQPLLVLTSEDGYMGGESTTQHYVAFANGNLAPVLRLTDDFQGSDDKDYRNCRKITHDLRKLGTYRHGLPDLLVTSSFSKEGNFTDEKDYCNMAAKPGRTFWRQRTRLIFDGTIYCTPRKTKDTQLPACAGPASPK